VGFTKGSGEFHFSNGLYSAITSFANEQCDPTAKQSKWGTGFRNRREVIRKSLLAIGLSGDWLYHGIEREVFVVPLARNTREFLRGEHQRLRWYDHSQTELVEHFKDRWLLRRAAWDNRFMSWSRDDWRIWLGNDR
jgi:hypothetical protein